MNFKTFNSANTILGENALKYLNDIEEKRIAIVMGGRSQQNIIDDIISNLKKSGKESKVVANIKNEPSMGDIVQPLKNVMNFKPDCILALGGGSVIDSAKALWIFYEYPDLKWEDVLLPNPVPVLGNKARLIAVPTTSGTVHVRSLLWKEMIQC
ncbi:iron-containing alcohol dehydrogenase [Acidilutibacter cellobiosedens]|jgi:alcohol dehydrogenase class IV|uniref:Iron-containing alcohol dehydrogenase n=1 Tax=Acidilutibacter cellobiosedens TaxID=2507161 RepID=A0A410Q9E0_9FIRM|nr:iron-containing alcohol dehydrogenase [Acidilutibacter cellobiosedens]MBE6083769.1 iron-containing alcohol dehydrogenase [Tissierellaceae bacterium]QAT60622.1 iron-containing alcohol dehydrogenase [Acidilutibacter cellobiosedens]